MDLVDRVEHVPVVVYLINTGYEMSYMPNTGTNESLERAKA